MKSISMNLTWSLFLAAIAAMGLFTPVASAQSEKNGWTVKSTVSAIEAWEKGQGGAGVQRDLKGGLTLYDTTLVQDDGPGVGADVPYIDVEDRSPYLRVAGQSILKKVLVVDRPEAVEARVYCQSPVAIEVNGKVLGTPRGNTVPVPAGLLKKGENVVILRAVGDGNAGVKVAALRHILANNPELKDRPARSFQSADGGKTWTPVDGELVVRLNLRQYRPEGHFLSPVMDVANLDANRLYLGKAALRSAFLKAEGDMPKGTNVEFFVRTGPGPVYDAKEWSDWQAPDKPDAKDHRFFQWRADLRTSDPRVTPTLKAVILEAKGYEPSLQPAWSGNVAVKGFHNPEIRYTSMPFEYEDPTNPRVIALRNKYKLDEVVKDGNTEFEKLLLLRNWVKAQWKYHPPEGRYPAWDADEILTRKIGFCVQYAITYVQCCTALGYQARFVFGFHPGGIAGSGHEVTEVWSNQFGKWIVMDPEGNRHYVDPKTLEPLSMLESHERMMKTYYGDGPADSAHRPTKKTYSDLIVTASGKEVAPAKILTAGDPPPKNWPAWSKWYNIRYVPRNNFYSKPAPLPRIQGWGGWEWPGFWAWYDEQAPRDWRYGNFTSRRSDLEWTINQVRFAAEWGDKPCTLAVRMGTVTPNFETYLVNAGGQGWKPSSAAFVWELKPGRNRLEMRVRNKAGIDGPVSFLEVQSK